MSSTTNGSLNATNSAARMSAPAGPLGADRGEARELALVFVGAGRHRDVVQPALGPGARVVLHDLRREGSGDAEGGCGAPVGGGLLRVRAHAVGDAGEVQRRPAGAGAHRALLGAGAVAADEDGHRVLDWL